MLRTRPVRGHEKAGRINGAGCPNHSMTTLDKDIYYSNTVFQSPIKSSKALIDLQEPPKKTDPGRCWAGFLKR
jgi:hypothetical protein